MKEQAGQRRLSGITNNTLEQFRLNLSRFTKCKVAPFEFKEQTLPHESTAQKLSFDWSHNRVYAQQSKLARYNHTTLCGTYHWAGIKEKGLCLRSCTGSLDKVTVTGIASI